jgi:integrase
MSVVEKPRRQLPPGIVERHSRSCASRDGGSCGCEPSYVAWIYDARTKSKRYKTFRGKGARTAAKNWRSDAGSALRKGTLPVPSRLTVEQAAEAWLAGARAGEITKPDGTGYKPIVLRQYAADLETKLLPELGHVRLSSLQRRDVQRVVDRLVGSGLSGSRVRGAVMPLRAICRRALQNDELVVNPTSNLVLPAATGVRDRVASDSETVALLAALPETDRPLWATAFYAGLRRGELRALQADDIDVEAGVIHVRRGWDDVEGAIEPKSRKGIRRVPLVSELRLLLLEHLARTGRRGTDLAFGKTPQIPFEPTTVRKRALGAWAATAIGSFLQGHVEVELEPIGLHEARHTYVSWMHDAGFSLERIGDYVGHSGTYMTERYRHLRKGHEQEAVDVLDAYLANRTGTRPGTQRPALAAVPHG